MTAHRPQQPFVADQYVTRVLTAVLAAEPATPHRHGWMDTRLVAEQMRHPTHGTLPKPQLLLRVLARALKLGCLEHRSEESRVGEERRVTHFWRPTQNGRDRVAREAVEKAASERFAKPTDPTVAPPVSAAGSAASQPIDRSALPVLEPVGASGGESDDRTDGGTPVRIRAEYLTQYLRTAGRPQSIKSLVEALNWTPTTVRRAIKFARSPKQGWVGSKQDPDFRKRKLYFARPQSPRPTPAPSHRGSYGPQGRQLHGRYA